MSEHKKSKSAAQPAQPRELPAGVIPYDQARQLARSTGIKTQQDWYALRATHLPAQLAPDPDKVYRDAGWTSWADFLGS